MKKRKLLVRVDMQVSILVAIMVLVSSLCIFFLCYAITYQDMILSLQDRVNSIYEYLELSLDKDTFQNINSKDDMNENCYQEMKETLEDVRDTTGVMYLYTAKAKDDGTLIYVVDGLDYAAEDFRYPGDAIETEIQEDLNKALQGATILPGKVKTTEWGKIFISYMPIHDKNKVVGAVGIEFAAEHQYNTYRILKILTPIISVILCAIAVVISFYSFRRISNPHYKDMSNTDKATQLKNRNAFDIDMQNLIAQKNMRGTGVISIDLNKLKKVNDTFGHTMGDLYIQLAADVLLTCCESNMVFYRVGGDEFAGIVVDADEERVYRFLDRVHEKIQLRRDEIGMDISLSVGFALFDSKHDKDLNTTYQRADEAMYRQKKSQKIKEGKNV